MISNERPCCEIERAEQRGITINQLRAVHRHVERRCVVECWRDHEGRLLTPEEVKLYDCARYVIKPEMA